MMLPVLLAQIIDTSPLPKPASGGSGDLGRIFAVVFGLAALIAIAIVVYGGVRFIASRGNSAETVKARHIIVYGLVGLGVVLLSTAIVTFVIGI